ncbi:MAG: methyltransferase domain-containing protein [Alphaproteobacteria bacterium]|nr:methyltransferase domain-containing protein [Alphaproteobacteria bacterium]
MMRLLFKALAAISRRLPASWVEALVLTLINARADSLPSPQGLRMLFRLDNRLYEAQSRLAQRHDGGTHPKHRITRYHDFFVDRIGGGERVLDVGCGKGALSFSLATQAGAQVTGIDLSADNIATAKQRFKHASLSFLEGDALSALPEGRFDAVILSNVLEHLPERPAFLKRLMTASCARKILLRVPLIERDWRAPLKRELGVEWRTDPTHHIEYTLQELADELQSGGLTVDEIKVCWGEAWVVAHPVAMEGGHEV